MLTGEAQRTVLGLVARHAPVRRSRLRARQLLDQLRDERGRKVMLVSHCLLNQNTRYAGAARRDPARSPKRSEELIGGQVVRDVIDYERSGISVAGIVGIGGSSSCGVMTTLDLAASMEVVAACPAASLTREFMNESVVLACRRPRGRRAHRGAGP